MLVLTSVATAGVGAGAQETSTFRDVRPPAASGPHQHAPGLMESRRPAASVRRDIPQFKDIRPLVTTADRFEEAQAAYRRGDYKTALRIQLRLAEQGDADAQNNLGIMYAHGQSVARDYVEAMKWYRLAADQGHPSARLNLGLMYAYGVGVTQDVVRGLMWVDLAAKQGLKDAASARDGLAEGMTASQIAEAEKLADKRKPKRPQTLR
jgi:TPR repeat protein